MPTGIYKHKPFSEETKNKIGNANRGIKHSDESRKNMSEAHKGKKLSQLQKDKIGAKSKKMWEERKDELLKKFVRGENHPSWQGGKSFELYSVDWTKTLKRSIRERDNYICQICKKLQCDVAFDVHHIDYNKKNCNPKNLITLCKNCHMKTNQNRDYWIKYFKSYLKLLLIK